MAPRDSNESGKPEDRRSLANRWKGAYDEIRSSWQSHGQHGLVLICSILVSAGATVSITLYAFPSFSAYRDVLLTLSGFMLGFLSLIVFELVVGAPERRRADTKELRLERKIDSVVIDVRRTARSVQGGMGHPYERRLCNAWITGCLLTLFSERDLREKMTAESAPEKVDWTRSWFPKPSDVTRLRQYLSALDVPVSDLTRDLSADVERRRRRLSHTAVELHNRVRSALYYDPTDPVDLDTELKRRVYLAFHWGSTLVSTGFLASSSDSKRQLIGSFREKLSALGSNVIDSEYVDLLDRALETRPSEVKSVIGWALSLETRYLAWERSHEQLSDATVDSIASLGLNKSPTESDQAP